MRRLEGPGHEQRLARAKEKFKRSRVGPLGNPFRRLFRKSGGPVGLLVLGAGIGASTVILFDAMQQPVTMDRQGLFSDGVAYYASCRDAFQAGRANIPRGEPGYRAALDADADGRACEPYIPINR